MADKALQAVVNSLNKRSDFFEAVLSGQSTAPTILGGSVTMKSNLNVSGPLSVVGAVGFNGAIPLTKQSVPGEVLSVGDATAVTNLANSMRSVLVAYGLMQ